MKEQQLICENDYLNFTIEVNKKLREGWKFVPTSLQISTSMTGNMSGDYNYRTQRFFAVILERE